MEALAAFGITVETVVPLEIEGNPQNAAYLATKKHKLGHHLALVADSFGLNQFN